MNRKKSKQRLAVFAGISFIAGSVLKIILLDFDAAVINYGFATVRLIRTTSTILFLLFVVSLLLVIYLQVTDKISSKQEIAREKEAKKNNPNYDENEIMLKLDRLCEENSIYEKDLLTARKMLDQMNECIADLQELQANNEYELLDKIHFSMTQAKTQILQNTKSIINRVTVEGDANEISKRVNNSSEIIGQVRGLLNETVNYLDSKSPSTKADLESMTKALQTLNKTME